jgi:predicted nucleotidyltransferase
MRLSERDAATILSIVREEIGTNARARVFGSRLHDDIRGGDLDLLVEVNEAVANPAWVSASLEARISRAIGGRSVDVVLSAPNLRHLGVHEVARREGVSL